MVQQFCVLKCYNCHMFQVHIVKKAKTWNCKICNSKQSIIKIFGQGTAKDCRVHVQKLNELRKTQNGSESEEHYYENIEGTSVMIQHSEEYSVCDDNRLPLVTEQFNPSFQSMERENNGNHYNFNKKSKWDCYLDKECLVERNTISKKNFIKNENSVLTTRIVKKSKWDNYLNSEEKKNDLSLETTSRSYDDGKHRTGWENTKNIENHSRDGNEPLQISHEAVNLDINSSSSIRKGNKVFNLYEYNSQEEIDDILNF